MVKHNYSKIIQNWQVAIPHCYWEWSCLFGHMWHQLLSWTCWYVSLIVGKAQGWGLDLRVENDTQRKLGDLSVDCTLFGNHDQVRPDRSIWGFWWDLCFYFITSSIYVSCVCSGQNSRLLEFGEQTNGFIRAETTLYLNTGSVSHTCPITRTQAWQQQSGTQLPFSKTIYNRVPQIQPFSLNSGWIQIAQYNLK